MWPDSICSIDTLGREYQYSDTHIYRTTIDKPVFFQTKPLTDFSPMYAIFKMLFQFLFILFVKLIWNRRMTKTQ